MPMTPGEKILINWMAETGNGWVKYGPELSAAIDIALGAKDLEIAELKKSLVSSPIAAINNDIKWNCAHEWWHYEGDPIETCKWCDETNPAAKDNAK